MHLILFILNWLAFIFSVVTLKSLVYDYHSSVLLHQEMTVSGSSQSTKSCQWQWWKELHLLKYYIYGQIWIWVCALLEYFNIVLELHHISREMYLRFISTFIWQLLEVTLQVPILHTEHNKSTNKIWRIVIVNYKNSIWRSTSPATLKCYLMSTLLLIAYFKYFAILYRYILGVLFSCNTVV